MRPKSLDRVGIYGTAHIFFLEMVHRVMGIAIVTKVLEGPCFVGVGRGTFPHIVEDMGNNIRRFVSGDNSRHHFAAPFRHAQYNGLIVLALLVAASDKGVIGFNSLGAFAVRGTSPST